jgi:hypothetical protein
LPRAASGHEPKYLFAVANALARPAIASAGRPGAEVLSRASANKAPFGDVVTNAAINTAIHTMMAAVQLPAPLGRQFLGSTGITFSLNP